MPSEENGHSRALSDRPKSMLMSRVRVLTIKPQYGNPDPSAGRPFCRTGPRWPPPQAGKRFYHAHTKGWTLTLVLHADLLHLALAQALEGQQRLVPADERAVRRKALVHAMHEPLGEVARGRDDEEVVNVPQEPLPSVSSVGRRAP